MKPLHVVTVGVVLARGGEIAVFGLCVDSGVDPGFKEALFDLLLPALAANSAVNIAREEDGEPCCDDYDIHLCSLRSCDVGVGEVGWLFARDEVGNERGSAEEIRG